MKKKISCFAYCQGKIEWFLNLIGHSVCTICGIIGRMSLFLFFTIKAFYGKLYVKEIFHQFVSICFSSVTVIAMTAVFSGMVLALQTFAGFNELANETTLAKVLSVGIIRELGPVMTGLMFGGTISSAIAAEIGTMVVTDQVEALKTMNVNIFKFLVVPRILGALLSVAILIFVADSFGILGGIFVSVASLNLSKMILIQEIINNIDCFDFMVGFVKSLSFGVVASFFGCYYGLSALIGSKAVGSSTTNAVISSSVMVLILNYLLTWAFF